MGFSIACSVSYMQPLVRIICLSLSLVSLILILVPLSPHPILLPQYKAAAPDISFSLFPYTTLCQLGLTGRERRPLRLPFHPGRMGRKHERSQLLNCAHVKPCSTELLYPYLVQVSLQEKREANADNGLFGMDLLLRRVWHLKHCVHF